MKKTSAAVSLASTILLLENRRTIEWELLKEQIGVVNENLKPVNLVKNLFKEVTTSVDIKDNLIDNAIGITTGYIARKILWSSSRNPLINILGTILQMGISNIVTKHPDAIKSTGLDILKSIFSRHKPDTTQ